MCLETIVRNVPNEYKYKAEWMEANADSVETIILGTSHAFYGLDPSVFGKKAFSLANSAQKLQYDAFLLSKYSDRYKNLKHVILSVSYFTLFDKDAEEAEGESWRSINYKVYFGDTLNSSNIKNNFFIFHPKPLEEKFKRFLAGDTLIACAKNGFGYPIFREHQNHTLDDASALVWVNLHTMKDWSNLDNNILYLKQIANECHKRHAQFVIVTTPTWHTYYDKLDQKQLNKMHEVINDLQKQFSVKYIDLLKDNRFVEDDFTDCNHMSCVGARKLSLIIKNCLNI
jgi:hypothetical protein